MKDKIKNTKIWVIFWLITLTTTFFLYHISVNMKDYWLYLVILSFAMFIIQGVKLEILKNK